MASVLSDGGDDSAALTGIHRHETRINRCYPGDTSFVFTTQTGIWDSSQFRELRIRCKIADPHGEISLIPDGHHRHLLAGGHAGGADDMTVRLSIEPQVVNLKLYRGDDAFVDIVVSNDDGSPTDLTGAMVRAQVRKSVAATTATSWDTTIDGDTIHLHLDSTVSESLPTAGVWDVELTDRGGHSDHLGLRHHRGEGAGDEVTAVTRGGEVLSVNARLRNPLVVRAKVSNAAVLVPGPPGPPGGPGPSRPRRRRRAPGHTRRAR